MANLIILEGVSRTGKSSITKILSNEYGFKHISIVDKMPDFIESDKLPAFYHGMHIISNQFFKALPNETFVLDRSFLSEIVYSKFFNRTSFINCDDVISDLLFDNNFVMINLTATYENYLERVPKDKMVYTESDFHKQKDLFYWHFDKYKSYSGSPNWDSRFEEIDTSKYSIQDSIKLITNKLITNSILQHVEN